MQVLSNSDIKYQIDKGIKLPNNFYLIKGDEVHSGSAYQFYRCKICDCTTNYDNKVFNKIGIGFGKCRMFPPSYQEQVICKDCLSRIDSFDKSIITKIIDENLYNFFKEYHEKVDPYLTVEKLWDRFKNPPKPQIKCETQNSSLVKKEITNMIKPTKFMVESDIFLENLIVGIKQGIWTVSQLASAANVTEGSVENWINKKNRITTPHMKLICEHHGRTYNWMTGSIREKI